MLNINGNVCNDSDTTSQEFNNHFCNIVKDICKELPLMYNECLEDVFSKYDNHESIISIKKQNFLQDAFHFSEVDEDVVLKLLNWFIGNWTPGNKLPWNSNQNELHINKLIRIDVCKMKTISSRAQCVDMLSLCLCFNSLRPSDAYMRRQTNHHWFREWLVAWTAPSHYLNQCLNIVNSTLRNKLQWNFNRNSNIFIQENVLENGVCEMASILSRPQCVNSFMLFLRCLFTGTGEIACLTLLHRSHLEPLLLTSFNFKPSMDMYTSI